MAGRQTQGKKKFARRSPDMSEPLPDVDCHGLEDVEGTYNEEVVVSFEIGREEYSIRRVITRTQIHEKTDELVGFAVCLQARQTVADWKDVTRVDTSHGKVHIHHFTADGADRQDSDTVPQKCRGAGALKAALSWAVDYAWHEERFQGWP